MDKCTKGVDILRILDFFLNRNVSALSNFPRIRVHFYARLMPFPHTIYNYLTHVTARSIFLIFSLHCYNSL